MAIGATFQNAKHSFMFFAFVMNVATSTFPEGVGKGAKLIRARPTRVAMQPPKPTAVHGSFTYPAPSQFCDHCGMSGVTESHSHIAARIDGSGAFGRDYFIDQYEPNLVDVNYDFGLSSPGKKVKIVRRQECCNGLLPCIEYDEWYTGRIIGHEWPYYGERQPPPQIWYPLLFYYQSFE